jgi:hypothetical protein
VPCTLAQRAVRSPGGHERFSCEGRSRRELVGETSFPPRCNSPRKGDETSGGSDENLITQSSPVLPPLSGRTQRPLSFCPASNRELAARTCSCARAAYTPHVHASSTDHPRGLHQMRLRLVFAATLALVLTALIALPPRPHRGRARQDFIVVLGTRSPARPRSRLRTPSASAGRCASSTSTP